MSIGQALAEAREKSGLSVEEVAASTRIRQTVIKAIEQDDYSLCGGDFYARGHIRNIARTVGTDPAPLLAEFDSGHQEERAPQASTVFEAERRAALPRRGPNWSAAMAVALVLILCFGIYRVVTASPSGSGTGTAAHRTTAPQPSSAGSASPSPQPSSSSTILAQAPHEVTVVVRGSGGNSWLSVRSGSGKQVFQGLLADGQVRTFTDPKLLHFTIGNAGAVQLVVNGKSIGRPGSTGQVVRVDFSPTDPATG